MRLKISTKQFNSMMRWLFPLPYIWVSSTIYIGVLLIYTIYHFFYSYVPINTSLLLILMFALLALDRFEFHQFGETPPIAVAWLLILHRLVLIDLASIQFDLYYLSFLYAFVPFIAVMQLGWRAGCLVALNVWLLYMFKISLIYPLWIYNILRIDSVLTFHIMLAFTLTMALLVLREKESRQRAEDLLKQLETSHQQLQTYAQQVESLATIQERSRIARDIHDTLGHYLTAMSIQLEKATVFFEQKPQIAYQSIQESKTLADEALSEVRHSVGILRSEVSSFSLDEALKQMIKHIQSQKLQIHFDIIGDTTSLPEPLLIVLYRVAQEGLTNIQKHANASEVILNINIKSQTVDLLLQDNGCGFEHKEQEQANRGYGLHGLKERLRLVGGTLDITSQIGLQTQLIVSIPVSII